MRFTQHRDEDGQGRLPMTSMIDVVFLLLIYFMVTASFSTPENDLASGLRAQQEGSGQAADLQPQILSVVLEDGSVVYRLGDRALTARDRLVELLSRLNKDAGVFVRVSGEVPVEAAAVALQACKDAGITRVTYVPST